MGRVGELAAPVRECGHPERLELDGRAEGSTSEQIKDNFRYTSAARNTVAPEFADVDALSW